MMEGGSVGGRESERRERREVGIGTLVEVEGD